jgi:hypothetical protein
VHPTFTRHTREAPHVHEPNQTRNIVESADQLLCFASLPSALDVSPRAKTPREGGGPQSWLVREVFANKRERTDHADPGRKPLACSGRIVTAHIAGYVLGLVDGCRVVLCGSGASTASRNGHYVLADLRQARGGVRLSEGR